MKKSWPFVFCLITIFSITLPAQNVPGYLGKRFAVGYTAVMMPGMGPNPGVNTPYSRSRRSGSLIFNYQHRFTTEYVVGKKWSITGDVMLSKIAFDVEHDYRPYVFPDDWGRGSAMGFIVGARKYRRHLAPLSRFFGYKLGYYTVRTDPYNMKLGYNNSGNPESNFTLPGIQTGTLMLGFSFGTNRVVYDKAMLTFGMDFSILMQGRNYSNSLIGMNASPMNDFDYEKANARQNSELMENLAMGRVYAESLINFSIGISLLP